MKRVLLLLLFIPVRTTGQNTDHPATSLARMQEAFRVEAARRDYPKMISLMDSMIMMEMAIDRHARPRVLRTCVSYASLFGTSAEGRTVHHLFMHTRFPESRQIYGMQLLDSEEEISGIPALNYQYLMLDGPLVYPCKDLYELALFVLKDYATLTKLLEKGRGNVPHNLIAARFLRTLSLSSSPWQRMAGLDSLIGEFPQTEPISHVYLEKIRLLTGEDKYDEALKLCRQTYRSFRKSRVRKELGDMMDCLTEPSLRATIKRQIYPLSQTSVVVTRRNLGRYSLQIRDDRGKRIFSTTYRNLPALVYKTVSDTITFKAPEAGTYTLSVKKGKICSDVPFYAGRVASMFRTSNDTAYVYATDLKSGQPLETTEVRFLNQGRSPFSLTLDGFTPLDVRTGDSFRLCVSTDKPAVLDTFSMPITVQPWDFSYGQSSGQALSAALFTDRKLYRKEDTIFFKGIVTRYEHGKSEPVTGKDYCVVLRNNDNYRDTLDYLDVRTNEFGSFSGYFLARRIGLNGAHSITIQGASAWFHIEEYTRPSFAFDLHPVKQPYAFGDTIIQEGVVTNYAGFPLGGITVTCQVYQRNYFRPSRGFSGVDMESESPLFSDTLYTDGNGAFRFGFPAVRPPEKIIPGTILEMHLTAIDLTGETHQKQTCFPISEYRYTVRPRFRNAKGDIHNRIFVLETGPSLAIEVQNNLGFKQEVRGRYNLVRNGILLYTGSFTGKDTYQPPWSSMGSGQWDIILELEGAPRTTESFWLLSIRDTISPADTAVFFCPLGTADPAFLLGTVEESLYALAEWYVSGVLIKKEHLRLQPGMQLFSLGDNTKIRFPLELRLVAVRDGIYHEHKHTWETDPDTGPGLEFVSMRKITGPYSRESFALKYPAKEKAEVLVSIFNKSTDRLSPNSFEYFPARAPYMPMPAIRHYFMQQSAPGVRGILVPGLYYAAGKDDASIEMLKIENDTAERNSSPAIPEEMPVIRNDFEETLAFLPHLQPDSTGLVPVGFMTNGLLSTFRILVLAHTSDGKSATAEETLLVRKEVMAMPSFPAFLREKDRIALTAAVVNLTPSTVKGNAYLTIGNGQPGYRTATLFPSGRVLFRWNYQTPAVEAGQVPLTTITAGFVSPGYNDAERHTIPILSLKEQVTRAQTRILQGNGLVTLVKKDQKSREQLDVSTPLVSAFNALPALCEPSGYNLTRWVAAFYANNTGAWLLKRYPNILASLRQNPAGQASALDKNDRIIGEILTEETPWTDYPGREAERIARLLRMVEPGYISAFNHKAMEQFRSLQRHDGGFSWFPGMQSSYTLTLHFLEKMGEMTGMGVIPPEDDQLIPMVRKAVSYMDSLFAEHIEKNDIKNFSADVTAYFYVRSAFPDIPYAGVISKIATQLAARPEEAWKGASVMDKAYLAIILQRWGKTSALKALLASLKELAICDPATGCYFPNAVPYDGLMNSEMKAHALLLRIFAHEPQMRNGIIRWILDRKQNNIWSSHESTTDVIYTLLHYGGGSTEELPQYETIRRGTTYTVRNRSGALLYVSLYEQTLEDISQMQPYANGLEVSRSFFSAADNRPLAEGDTLRKGERIVARYHLKNDRDLSFVHLKASRAACLIPESEISEYQWNDTCSWFREVNLSATQYFFQNLATGGHVIEERFYVTQQGVFNQGSLRVQSLYAPVYRSFSPGRTLVVGE